MTTKQHVLGVIGGTGLYDMPGLSKTDVLYGSTPFDNPTGKVITGELEGLKVVFLARHGVGHMFGPRQIPYPANVWAMKKLGVTHLVSVTATGSLSPDVHPGHFVVVDQFFDRTMCLPATFFSSPGVVVHVPFGNPVCAPFSKLVYHACVTAKGEVAAHLGGTYVCIAGPQFSTYAESVFFQGTIPNATNVGMTALPEARLAREAELCYAAIALTSDWDCWNQNAPHVDGDMVKTTLAANTDAVVTAITALARSLANDDKGSDCSCNTALTNGAIHTDPARITPENREKFDLLIGHRIPALQSH